MSVPFSIDPRDTQSFREEMTKDRILHWLLEGDHAKLELLWTAADETRCRHVGDAVHLRGLVEISNYCVQNCGYCGIRRENSRVVRYRMTRQEIEACVKKAVEFGYGTVVLQSGEDYGITAEWMADIVRWIKAKTPLAVTLSLGERPDEQLVLWREAGADRYLIRFETSDRALYAAIHPALPGRISDRIALLGRLRQIGYEIGSGVMVGILGQTYQSLAADIQTFQLLDLDMIGVGPYIPHPDTPLGSVGPGGTPTGPNQVPADETMVTKVIALSRLICHDANIPSTTALATINRADGREVGLMRGANIVMPNLTPGRYRALYEIYPNKACIFEDDASCNRCITGRIGSIKRAIGTGQGGRNIDRTIADDEIIR